MLVKKNFKGNPRHDILRFFVVFSAQVKSSVIITNKNGIYQLPYELRNDSRLKISGNKEM